jgi:Organic Anion Transporter Polypeptide (OATP) family
MKMLGPAVGYSIGSFFLKKYIDPSLTPTINNTDPRWLGAWWAGWAVLGSMLLVLAVLISMFPHTMPRTVARRREARARGEKVEKAASSEKATLPGAHFYSSLKFAFSNAKFVHFFSDRFLFVYDRFFLFKRRVWR